MLVQAFPQGLDAHDPEHARRLRLAYRGMGRGQSSSRPRPGPPSGLDQVRAGGNARLRRRAGRGAGDPADAQDRPSPSTARRCGPTGSCTTRARRRPGCSSRPIRAAQASTRPCRTSRWKASPDTRMMELLHDTGVRLGLVTNGDHWMLVDAPKNETTGFASWYAHALARGADHAAGLPHPARCRPVLRRAGGRDARSAARQERRRPAGSHRPAWLSGPPGGRGA